MTEGICKQVTTAVEEPLPMLDRTAILQASDLALEPVNVPEWGGRVMIRRLSGTERATFENLVAAKEGDKDKLTELDMGIHLVIAGTADAEGKPLFTPEDGKWLREKAGSALLRVGYAVMHHNALTQGDVEALRGNS